MYKKTEEGIITYDGKFIPIDENNADYKKYLKWVSEGNTAEVVITTKPFDAQAEIQAVYPLWKQIYINELQGYTKDDKDAMWIFINNIRNKEK